MPTIYIPRLIETAEQAEALPIGTVAIESSHQELAEAKGYGPGAPLVRCAHYEPYTWHNDYDGSVGHDYAIGYVALVPIEAEEEFGAEMHWFPDGPADKTMTGRARDRENAEWQRDHNPHLATGRVMTRLVTPWEEV